MKKMHLAVHILLAVSTYSSVLADQLDIHLTDHVKNETDTRFCSAETASFGSTFAFWAMKGVVVNAAPLNACQPVLPPPYVRNDSQSWVALVARDRSLTSGCPFDVKILHAQSAGFDAVLVYNFEDAVLAMQASEVGNKIHIPAAMVSLSCGNSLRNNCAYSIAGNRFSLSFEIPFPFDFHVYVISFAVIIGICLLLSLLVWGIKLYRDWRRTRRNRLPRSSLKKLKVKKFEKGTDPYDCCAICLEDFEPGEKLRILPCNHAYHTKCVDQWLLKSRSTCPVCKRRVFPRSGDESDDGEDAEAAGVTGVGVVDIVDGGASTSAASAAAASETSATPSTSASSASLHDERTPLLGAVAALALSSSTAAATATVAPTAATTTASASFDNAALDDSTVDEADAGDGGAAASTADAGDGSRGLSVEVFVHRPQEESAAAAAASSGGGAADA